jgi:NADH-quinone oxidoreductase subunit J
MLLEVREALGTRYSKWLLPASVAGVLLVGALGISVWQGLAAQAAAAVPTGGAVGGTVVGPGGAAFGMGRFSASFLHDYWLHFELTSVLLLAAVVAALAVIKVSRRARHG